MGAHGTGKPAPEGPMARPSSPPPGKPAAPPPTSKLRFSVDMVRDLLGGALPQDEERTVLTGRDRRGLTVAGWAGLQAATDTSETLRLVQEMVEPSQVEDETARRIVELLEAQAEAMVRVEQRLAVLEGMLRAGVRPAR